MERRCAGVVDAGGVAGGEMGEDSLDDLGRLDAGDDAQRGATHATVFDVDRSACNLDENVTQLLRLGIKRRVASRHLMHDGFAPDSRFID